MSDLPLELENKPQVSPEWRDQNSLTEKDRLELQGTSNMVRLVETKVLLAENPDFEGLAKQLFTEIFKPFGHNVFGYREVNSILIGASFEPSDYTVVPRKMREYGREMDDLFEATETRFGEIGPVIRCAAKAHGVVYIHPFTDGNGRVARGVAQYVLRRFGMALPDWRFAGRSAYLEAVDNGSHNIADFESFLAKSLINTYHEREFRAKKAEDPALVALSRKYREEILGLEAYLKRLKAGNASL